MSPRSENAAHGTRGVPAREWTDDEWLAVMRTVPPDAPASVGEAAVAEMRGGEGRQDA